MRVQILRALEDLDACLAARNWVSDQDDPEGAWDACDNPGWLLWLAIELGVDRARILAATCRYVRLVTPGLPEQYADALRLLAEIERGVPEPGRRAGIREELEALYDGKPPCLRHDRLAAIKYAINVALLDDPTTAWTNYIDSIVAGRAADARPAFAAVVRALIPYASIKAAAGAKGIRI